MKAGDSSIVLFGSLSRFTFFTLKFLLEGGFRIQGIVLAAFAPASSKFSGLSSDIHHAGTHDIIELANACGISIHYFATDLDALRAYLEVCAADLFLLSCYSRKLPPAIIALARQRCINIHPSRLPAFRGPDPIFWQLRSGETNTGISLHDVSDTIDGGDLVGDQSVPLPDGASLEQIQILLIKAAVRTLTDLFQSHPKSWQARRQNAGQSSWYRLPCQVDHVVCGAMTARTVFNFVRAYSHSNHPISVVDGTQKIQVNDATRYSRHRVIQGAQRASGSIVVKFRDGEVEFSVAK